MIIYLLLLLNLIQPEEKSLPFQPFCELHGAVYVETQDRNRARFSVYEEESEGFAQMLVFKEYSRTYAERPGLWYFVQNRGLADFTVYFEKEPGMADFSIYFTETASFAGCQ